jgi:hypothetical protein
MKSGKQMTGRCAGEIRSTISTFLINMDVVYYDLALSYIKW